MNLVDCIPLPTVHPFIPSTINLSYSVVDNIHVWYGRCYSNQSCLLVMLRLNVCLSRGLDSLFCVAGQLPPNEHVIIDHTCAEANFRRKAHLGPMHACV